MVPDPTFFRELKTLLDQNCGLGDATQKEKPCSFGQHHLSLHLDVRSRTLKLDLQILWTHLAAGGQYPDVETHRRRLVIANFQA